MQQKQHSCHPFNIHPFVPASASVARSPLHLIMICSSWKLMLKQMDESYLNCKVVLWGAERLGQKVREQTTQGKME